MDLRFAGAVAFVLCGHTWGVMSLAFGLKKGR